MLLPLALNPEPPQNDRPQTHVKNCPPDRAHLSHNGHASGMTEIFNQHSEKGTRQYLRNRMPKAEIILWGKIRRKQIAGVKFRRQYSVDRFVLDFYCPELKLAIEVDGPIHDSPEGQVYDQARQQFMEELGIQLLRFTNADVYRNLEGVLATIHQTVLMIRHQG